MSLSPPDSPSLLAVRERVLGETLDKLGGEEVIKTLKQKANSSSVFLGYIEQLFNPQLTQSQPLPNPSFRTTPMDKITKKAIPKSLVIRRHKSASSFSISIPSVPETTEAYFKSVTCVLRDQELQQMFHLFLKKLLCEENLTFLLELEDLDATPSDELLDELQRVYKEYIAIGSPKELNLDSGSAAVILKGLDEVKESYNEEKARSLFATAREKIISLLQNDSYHKFTATPEFIAYKKFALAKDVKRDSPLLPRKKLGRHRHLDLPTSAPVVEEHKVDFSDLNFIVREPILSRNLMEFLEKNHCEENLLFLKQVHALKISPPTKLLPYVILIFFEVYSIDRRVFRDIIAIFTRFVKSGSPDELNLDENMKKHIEKSIKTQEESLDDDEARKIYDRAEKQILSLLQTNSLQNFISSPEYEKCKETFLKIHGESKKSAASSAFLLTENDWELIHTGSTIRTFSKGENIVIQGEHNRCVYFLMEGVVIARCTKNNRRVHLPLLDTEGSVFGELGLFGSVPSYSSYIAHSEVVKVRELKTSFLFRLFDAHPKLGVRLYNFIGEKLSTTITLSDETDRQSQPEQKKQKTSSLSVDRSKNSTIKRSTAEAEFKKLFPDLPIKEKLIVSYPCSVPRSVVRSGTIYISQHYLAYSATIFGQKSKEIFPLFTKASSVTSSKETDFTITKSGHKRKLRMRSKEIRDVVVSLLESLITLENEDKSSRKGLKVTEENSNVEQIATALSEDEWKLILGSESDSCIKFQQGDYIMEEGQTYKTLFQTVSGTCNVEKKTSFGYDVLGSIEAGEVLGEINFFTQKAASASIVVTSDVAEVYLINKEYLWKDLLVTHPALVLRFYYHLCFIVGSRLTKTQ